MSDKDLKKLMSKMPKLPKGKKPNVEKEKDNGRRSNLYINETEIRKLLKNKR